MAAATSRLRRPLQLQTYTEANPKGCEWFSIAGETQ
jgi:hypothetical protein